MLGLVQLFVELAQVVGVVVQAHDVVVLPLEAGVVSLESLSCQALLVEQVAHDCIEVAHDGGVAVLVNDADALLECLQGLVAVVLLIVGHSLIVIECHLLGVVLPCFLTEADYLCEVFLVPGKTYELQTGGSVIRR